MGMARRFRRISRVGEKCCSLTTSCIYVSCAILTINGTDFRNTILFDFAADTIFFCMEQEQNIYISYIIT